ncbi:uncharacterized protein LOC121414325 [Lytechinus variegatus]|uniref:uncharacterized protein LOC121414325 n=1 Tax=Lytechinus variegatus TaxID=7654 RepID=UPI001BB16609|nr:uncharacterized protein LOC121414325 [Lytechinus variegatus]
MAGNRAKVRVFQQGVSGKQNAFHCPTGIDKYRKLVCIFGDSQMRTLVQGDVEFPKKRGCQFLVNSTPGGKCHHVEKELCHFEFPRRPAVIVLQVGTNNIQATNWQEALGATRKEFKSLLLRAKQAANSVLCVGVAPRLDEKGELAHVWNAAMRNIAAEEGAEWIDLESTFNTESRHLWARDGLHLSDDHGIPTLLKRLVEHPAL